MKISILFAKNSDSPVSEIEAHLLPGFCTDMLVNATVRDDEHGQVVDAELRNDVDPLITRLRSEFPQACIRREDGSAFKTYISIGLREVKTRRRYGWFVMPRIFQAF